MIAGGGTAGCVLARHLLESTDARIVLLEAGPDYGPFADGRWPDDLTDPRSFRWSHEWGYTGMGNGSGVPIEFWRARVVGGCSAHNGCEVVWGTAADYDAWAAAGLDGWSSADLAPVFSETLGTMRVAPTLPADFSPVSEAFVRSAAARGFPLVDDLARLETGVGISPIPRDIVDGVRWSAAFSHLDGVRRDERLTVVSEALVDRVELAGGRATGVHFIHRGSRRFVAGGDVILAGGVYGSPAMLLRSGIGPPDELRALGITGRLALPGVGRNLHDHPTIEIVYRGTPRLGRAMAEWTAANPAGAAGQLILKAPSSLAAGDFDYHVWMSGGMPLGGTSGWSGGAPFQGDPDTWRWQLGVACLEPRSRGALTLSDRSPDAPPVIDHGFLSDAGGHDLRVLVEGVATARGVVEQGLGELLGAELAPTAGADTDGELGRVIRRHCLHYWHPVGTCAMGLGSDAAAVVDARGRVHGAEHLYVADASVMPVVPRANTNVPTVVVAHRIAQRFASAA